VPLLYIACALLLATITVRAVGRGSGLLLWLAASGSEGGGLGPSVTRLMEDGTTRLMEDGTTRKTEGT
jgi:hypothetical protein